MKQYDCIYFMGDSWTVAACLSEDVHQTVTVHNRFSTLIGNHFGLSVINQSKSGCGNQTIFQTVYNDVNKLKSEGLKPLVVVSYTDPNRVELYNPKYGNIEVINQDSTMWDTEFYKTYLTRYFTHDANNDQSIYFILAVKTLLERHGLDYVDNWAFTPILENKYFNTNCQLEQTLLDIAGDEGRFEMPNHIPCKYGHANSLGNRKIADKLIEKIIQLYG